LQGKPKYSEKTCLSATVPPQIPRDQVRFRTPDRSGVKPATNRLSYGAAFPVPLLVFCHDTRSGYRFNAIILRMNLEMYADVLNNVYDSIKLRKLINGPF
jgi:hypothetical protein